LLQALENGNDVNLTTDGSKIINDEASGGWLFWKLVYGDEVFEEREDENLTDGRRRSLLRNTVLVDGQLASTLFIEQREKGNYLAP